MKLNAVTDLILNFDKMSQIKRLQRYQDLENMMASFQGRKPRTVTLKPNREVLQEIKKMGRSPVAYYSRNDRTKIYILKIDSAIDVVKDIIHEGWHAYIDDFIRGVVSLKTYAPIDRNKFILEEEYIESIYKEFTSRDLMPLCDAFHYEERINYLENSIYLTKYIIDSIQNPTDALILEVPFFQSLYYYVANEKRGRSIEHSNRVNYDKIVADAIAQKPAKTTDLSKLGKIHDMIDEDFLKFFIKVVTNYQEFYECEMASIMNPEVKNQIMSKKLANISQLYNDYAKNKIKSKIYI